MSRCYPYPPPGYALRRSSEGGLVKSIKLQTGTEKTKDEMKKEKRREKKERKNEKKEKRIHSEDKKHTKLGKPTSAHVHTHSMPFLTKNNKFAPKAEEVERELLERSSLTEEHNPPVCLVAPSTSSDSTENSKRRKRESPPEDVTRPRGNIIRIKLQPKKQIEPSATPVNGGKELLPCSKIGTIDVDNYTRARESREDVCSTSDIKGGLSSSTSRNHEAVAAAPVVKPERLTSVPKSSPALTPVQREQLLYTKLIENWAPPKLQQDSYIEEDLDWLFSSEKKQNAQASATTRRCGNDTIIACSSSVLQPRAQYLPEVDIFALPFTVPF